MDIESGLILNLLHVLVFTAGGYAGSSEIAPRPPGISAFPILHMPHAALAFVPA